MPLENAKNLHELLDELNREGIGDYRRYNAVRRFLSAQAYQRGVPLIGSFELTPLCNLRCKMCYVRLEPEQIGKTHLLSADEWISLMEQAIARGMMYARLTGGECLLHPGFRQIYAYLQSKGVEATILSNGLLFSEDLIEYLASHRPAGIQITLYGSNEDAYERVTGRRAFGQVMASIERIRRANLPLFIAVTPNRYALNDMEALLRLIKKLDLPYAINSGLFKARAQTGRSLNDYDVSIDDYIRIYQIQAALNGSVPLLCEDELPPQGGTAAHLESGIRCGAGRFAFSLCSDGTMYPCNILHEFHANPLETGFSKAWDTLRAEAVAFKTPVECQGCRYESICKHCVAEHLQNAPAGHASPDICAWSKRMVREGLIKTPDA